MITKHYSHLSWKISRLLGSQIELIFLTSYHQFPASSSREFALKRVIRGRLRLLPSWTYRTILMPDTSAISIIFDRTDNLAFSRIAKGLANGFFAVRLTAPREGYLDVSMRRGPRTLAFSNFAGRAFEQPRRRRRRRHGGRYELEQGRAQSKFRRINR
jgi:hypothetical protein